MPSPLDFYASSPAVVLPPPQPQPYFSGHYAESGSLDLNGGKSNIFGNPLNPQNDLLSTSAALAGRKRSRGDIHGPDDDDEHIPNDMPATITGPDPGSLPSESLLPRDPRSTASTKSQFDAWADGETFGASNPPRPSVPIRKSQRMDSIADSSDHLAQLVLPPAMREATREPLIDEVTRLLGISWTRMDSREALQINQAAYGKWIQHHYPCLEDVALWLENRAIPGYLVAARHTYRAQREYYLFSHDLTEARLVTAEPEQLVPRLRMLPALHLAAPGGCLRAAADPTPAIHRHPDPAPAAAAAADPGPCLLRGRIQDYAYPRGKAAVAAADPRPANGTGFSSSAQEMELD